MTLCIGALCDWYEPKIVVAFDAMASTDQATVENTAKMEMIGNRWWALLAGEVPYTRELMAVYRGHLKDIEKTLNSDNAFEELCKPAEEYLDRVRERLCRRLTSLSYAQFRAESEVFPEEIRDEIFKMPAPGIQLILMGCVYDNARRATRPCVYKYSFGEVWKCDHSAVIGSGTNIAEAALMQRKHSEYWTLSPTTYAVYEAFKLGCIAPGVGQGPPRMAILWYDAQKDALVPAPSVQNVALAVLEEWRKEFGLKDVRGDLALPDRAFIGLPPPLPP